MSMMHPAFNNIGSKKSKQKFKSAAEAQRHRDLTAEWEKNNEKWKSMSTVKVSKKTVQSAAKFSPVPVGRENDKVNRLNSWITGPVNTKPTQQYTGDNVLGISIIHKSCLQPVFNQQQAIDAATMRR